MKTYIKTAHEEEYSNKSKSLGVLININENGERLDSLIYVYRDGMYIFFDTIINMNDYLLYGESKIKRAYMSEEDFDKYYDDGVNECTFNTKLVWTKKK